MGDNARGGRGRRKVLSDSCCTKNLERARLPIKAEGVAAERTAQAERAERNVCSRDAGETDATPPPRSEGGFSSGRLPTLFRYPLPTLF